MFSKRSSLLALLLCIVLLTGCAAPMSEVTPSPATPTAVPTATSTPTPAPTPEPTLEPTSVPTLEEAFPLRLGFSSGAGGWGTELILQQDLSFSGTYTDSNLGDSGEGYNGSQHVCSFSGQFTDLTPIDEYSYSLTLSTLTSDYEEGKEWTESGILYISAEPYGIEQGTEFILYLPNTPTETLHEYFLSWWPGRYEAQKPGTLNYFGLYNVEMGYGFFG